MVKTIFNNGKTLEIEEELGITVSPFQSCYFCDEPIIELSGHDSDSLCNHHITYIPEVIVPTHFGCHVRYHKTHPDHPTNPEAEYRERFIESLGDNVMCYFCGEEITKKYYDGTAESLTLHSLDGDHGNWEPTNKVPTHLRCHSRYHNTGKIVSEETRQKLSKPHPWCVGDKNPSRRPDQRQRMRDNNPMKDPEVRAKHLESVRTPEYRAEKSERWMGDNHPMKDPEVAAKVAKALTGKPHPWCVGDKNPMKNPETIKKAIRTRRKNDPENMAPYKMWVTRRRLYPPNGMKPK